jgi:hypothetical protein
MMTQLPSLTPQAERYWNRYRLVQTLQSMAALWAAMALIALVMGAAGYRRALAQADWPSMPGIITATEINPGRIAGPGNQPAEFVRIVYGYEVDGATYSADRVNLNPVPVEADSDEGRRLLQTYPTGAAVTVYHDPANPSEAILEREPSPVGFYAGLALLGMAAVAGLAAFSLGRGLSDKPRPEVHS